VVASAITVTLAVGAFFGVRHWQETRPPTRVSGVASPLSSAPGPECASGVATTSIPAATASSQSLDAAALAWASSSGLSGLKTFQVTVDALPETSASMAAVSFADATRAVRARITVQRADSGGGWVVVRVERCS
jgi:hypothetical protein